MLGIGWKAWSTFYWLSGQDIPHRLGIERKRVSSLASVPDRAHVALCLAAKRSRLLEVGVLHQYKSRDDDTLLSD